jgi:thymidylate synthase (FAD)
MQILDHGYLKLIEVWGSDQSIIEAARMSTNKGFEGWGNEEKPGDEKLLKYLYTHKHFTPFEMGGLIIEVKAPIFVFREWHRHRTQSYNEMSSRYVPLPDENYIPSIERLMMHGGKNKQAKAVTSTEMTRPAAETFIAALHRIYSDQQFIYNMALQSGVPKELARIHLPVGRYSRMRASTNLRNWIAFLTLREDENAQWEIRQYANGLSQLIKELFPRTHELYQLGVSVQH